MNGSVSASASTRNGSRRERPNPREHTKDGMGWVMMGTAPGSGQEAPRSLQGKVFGGECVCVCACGAGTNTQGALEICHIHPGMWTAAWGRMAVPWLTQLSSMGHRSSSFEKGQQEAPQPREHPPPATPFHLCGSLSIFQNSASPQRPSLFTLRNGVFRVPLSSPHPAHLFPLCVISLSL